MDLETCNKENWDSKKSIYSWKKQSTLDPFKEEKEEDIQRIKKLQLELHSDFINLVKKVEPKLKDAEKNNIFTGEFWSGSASLN